MNTVNADAAATVLRLAPREGPCPDCKGTGRYTAAFGEAPTGDTNDHADCHGTGKVARFPMLRVPCGKKHFRVRTIGTSRRSRIPITCAEVACSGWVPVSGPAAVVALLEAGRPWHIGVWARDKGWQSGHLIPGMSNHTLTKECSTIEEALIAALEAATEVQSVTP